MYISAISFFHISHKMVLAVGKIINAFFHLSTLDTKRFCHYGGAKFHSPFVHHLDKMRFEFTSTRFCYLMRRTAWILTAEFCIHGRLLQNGFALSSTLFYPFSMLANPFHLRKPCTKPSFTKGPGRPPLMTEFTTCGRAPWLAPGRTSQLAS